MFWHPEHSLFLVIYVDDFKLAGPRDKLQLGWDLIKAGLKIEPPGPLGLYLGCKHEESTKVLPDTGVTVRVMEYNMEEFLRSCVDRSRELTGVQCMRKASTPFIAEPTAIGHSPKAMPILRMRRRLMPSGSCKRRAMHKALSHTPPKS